MRRLLALSLLLTACTLKPVADGGDGAGGGTGGAGGDEGEGGAAGVCSDSADCSSCRSCAADGPCKPQVDACLDDPMCVSLDECLALCGISPDCEETCRAQNASAVETYDEAKACLDCAVCADFCGGVTVCQ